MNILVVGAAGMTGRPLVEQLLGKNYKVRIIVRKSGNLVNKLERASHLSKDAGEIFACVGGVLLFWGIFHDGVMADAFKHIFMAYLYGHLTGVILVTVFNFHQSKEEDNALN